MRRVTLRFRLRASVTVIAFGNRGQKTEIRKCWWYIGRRKQEDGARLLPSFALPVRGTQATDESALNNTNRPRINNGHPRISYLNRLSHSETTPLLFFFPYKWPTLEYISNGARYGLARLNSQKSRPNS